VEEVYLADWQIVKCSCDLLSSGLVLTNVLSGDTVIIRPKELPEKGKPHKERYAHTLGP
jgi:hypothetical protein